uniref:PRA1 family protein n=1 Tax=Oryza meridionalis TaxID=40149 RepID=A0A0E0DJP5_9ORYZ
MSSSSSSFKPNPLSLSVPDPALDRWLRDSGYLDILDSSASASASASTSSSPSATTTTAAASSTSTLINPTSAAAAVLAFARTLASVLALNPFARLSTTDLAAPTPSWSLAFLGPPGAASYSWPPTSTQARLRVQENVRRYARNYAALSILVFACCLYHMHCHLPSSLIVALIAFICSQSLRLRNISATAGVSRYRMPMALLGMLAILIVWESVRYCRERWGLATRAPGVGQFLLHSAQIGEFSVANVFLHNKSLGRKIEDCGHIQKQSAAAKMYPIHDDVACFFSKIDSFKST